MDDSLEVRVEGCGSWAQFPIRLSVRVLDAALMI